LVKPKTEYELGFLHIDIKYLPRISGKKEGHHHLFVTIDRATRLAFVHVYSDQTDLEFYAVYCSFYQQKQGAKRQSQATRLGASNTHPDVENVAKIQC
jgi:hypothetical protein